MTYSAANLIPLRKARPKKLLGRDSNTKLVKTSKGQEILLAGLSMMPTPELCPSSKAAVCFDPCIKESGLAQVFKSINEARQRKTDWFLEDLEGFLIRYKQELTNLIKLAKKHGKKPVVRSNVFSDVAWEELGIPQAFPEIFWYDYTKRAARIGNTPDNYELMFSYSGAPLYQKQVEIALQTDVPIAVVFKNGMPKEFLDREFINGDKSDLANLKARNKVVGLKLKGNEAKKSNSPFIIDALAA